MIVSQSNAMSLQLGRDARQLFVIGRNRKVKGGQVYRFDAEWRNRLRRQHRALPALFVRGVKTLAMQISPTGADHEAELPGSNMASAIPLTPGSGKRE